MDFVIPALSTVVSFKKKKKKKIVGHSLNTCHRSRVIRNQIEPVLLHNSTDPFLSKNNLQFQEEAEIQFNFEYLIDQIIDR